MLIFHFRSRIIKCTHTFISITKIEPCEKQQFYFYFLHFVPHSIFFFFFFSHFRKCVVCQHKYIETYAYSDILFRTKFWTNQTMDRALLLLLWPTVVVYAKWQNVCCYGLLDFRTRCPSTGDGSMRFVFLFDFNVWSSESIDTRLILLSDAIFEFKIVHRIFHISKYLLSLPSIVLFIIHFILLILRRISICRLNLRFLFSNSLILFP